MPLLRNAQTGELELVADSEAGDLVRAGTYTIPTDAPLQVSAFAGQGGVTSAGQLAALEQPIIGQPATVVGEPTLRAQESAAYEKERYSGVGETGAAFMTGVADAATLGGFSALNRAVDDRDDLARSARQHSTAYTAGVAAGAIVTARPTGAAAFTPAGQLARAARGLGTTAPEVGRLGRFGAGALGGAIEGGAQGAGTALADAAIADDPFTVESVVARLPSRILGGAAIGGAIGGIAGTAARARKAVQAEQDAAQAAPETALGGPPPGAQVRDIPDMDLAAIRKAEDDELARIDADRVAERESIVDSIVTARNTAKKEKPWIALEGFKGKDKPAAKSGAVPAGQRPLAVAPPKPRPLHPRVRTEKLAIETTGDPITLRLQTTTRQSAFPDFEPSSQAIATGPDLPPPTTFVRVQRRLKDGEWVDVGGASMRHRPEGLAVEEVFVAPELQRRGIARRMFEAAEGRTGQRITGAATPETPDGAQLIARYLQERDTSLLAAAEAKRATLPTYERLGEVGGVVTKTVKVKDLAREVYATPGLDPKRLARVQEGVAGGHKFDPLYASVDPSGYYSLDDGKARLLAAMKAGKKTIKVRFTPIANARSAVNEPMFPKLQDEALARGAGRGRRARRDSLAPIPTGLAQEFRDLGKISFEADKKIDRLLRNPKALSDRPKQALEALQQQEHALDRLSVIAPELRRLMAGQKSSGLREAALDTLGAHLERNRTLQARLRGVLVEPTSPRITGLQTAREEIMAGAREPKSFAQSLTEGAVFAGATAIAAPLGIGAPLVGAQVARSVGRRFFRQVGQAGKSAAKSVARAAEAVLSGVRKVRPAAVPIASRVLSGTAFGAAPPNTRRAPAQTGHPSDSLLVRSFLARSRELLDQVVIGPDGVYRMSPDARERISMQLVGIAALSPRLADRIETALAARLSFLAAKVPKRPDMPGMGIGPDLWRPSTVEMRTFARYVAASEDPDGVETRLAEGTLSPEDAETYKALYPERLADLTRRIVEGLPGVTKRLPERTLISLSLMTGVPMHPGLDPQILTVLQASHEREPGTEGGVTSPTPQPQFGSVKSEPYTRAQDRAAP